MATCRREHRDLAGVSFETNQSQAPPKKLGVGGAPFARALCLTGPCLRVAKGSARVSSKTAQRPVKHRALAQAGASDANFFGWFATDSSQKISSLSPRLIKGRSPLGTRTSPGGGRATHSFLGGLRLIRLRRNPR